MTTTIPQQFISYLQSISDRYQDWWNHYILTDVEGHKQREQSFSSPFDFSLIVQTVISQTADSREKQEEKIERLSVLEGINKYASDHVLLLGKPGSGKSTALIRLLLEKANSYLATDSDNEVTIPILVELRYWKTSIFAQIKEFLQKHDTNLILDKTTLTSLLNQGQFLFLIDGVNELPSEVARRDVAAFRQKFRQTPMIFTTRDLSIGGDLGIEKKLEMQPLTETQIRDFVMAYLPQQGEEMLKCLRDRLREFGKTPLLLWMLYIVFQQTRTIPPNLGMVFRQFTQTYETSDLLKRNVPVSEDSRRWWQNLLEHLAFKMMQGNPVTEFRVAIPKGEVEDLFTEYLKNEKFDKPRDYAKHWLEDLLKHHLIQIGSDNNIEFRHQLLQEYYAAESLLRQLSPIIPINPIQLKRDYLNLLKWTEPIALMLALIDYETQALQIVQLALDVDLMLGARLAGEVKPKFQQLTIDLILNQKLHHLLEIELLGLTHSEYAVNPLIQKLNDANLRVRNTAAIALGNIGSDAAVNPLIQTLNDRDSDIRDSAVEALGNIGSDAAVEALIKELTDQDSSIFMNAKNALVKIGSEVAVNSLIQALNHQDSYTRYWAAQVLGNIGSEAAINSLIQALNDEDSLNCCMAAEALGKIGSNAAVEPLIKQLTNQDSSIHKRAAKALVKIGSEAAINSLIKTLNHEDSDVRYMAENALGDIGSEAAVNALTQALNDEDSDVRYMAANTLGEIGSEAAVNPLIQALNDEDSDVRYMAANALGDIGSEAAVNPLIKALDDEDVRHSAALALGRIGSEAAVNALIQLLRHKVAHISMDVAEILRDIGNEVAVNALVKALNDENLEIRKLAVYAFQSIGDHAILNIIRMFNPKDSLVNWRMRAEFRLKDTLTNTGIKDRATAALIKVLDDQDLYLRRQTVEALGNIGSEAAVAPLVEVLDEPDSYLRRQTVEALGKIGSEAAVNPLIKLLNNQDSSIRRQTVEALGKIGSEAAVEPLIKVLNDRDSSIRSSAANALGEIGSEAAVEPLIKVLNDKDIRNSAKNALGRIGSEAAVNALIQALNDQDLMSRGSAANALKNLPKSDQLVIIWDKFINGKLGAKYLILKIQDRCQFYNHDIFYSPPIKEEDQLNHPEGTTIHNYNGNVGNINIGDTRIQGNQTGIENNQSS